MLIARWLWAEGSLPARTARLALIPPSMVFRGITAARSTAYRHGLLRCGVARAPTISVGNLTVGGSGKTPIAAWIAQYYASMGLVPGILLRGYGGDEGAVHRKLVAEAIVVENPNRLAGAEIAIEEGADVLVLDDAYQRLDIERDLNIAVVSAESSRFSRWTLPAGPWREGWPALRRADMVIVTRKSAPASAAQSVMQRVARVDDRCPAAVARLGVSGFHRLLTGAEVETSQVEGASVLVAAGIADPDSLARQCEAFGARATIVNWRDHKRLSDRDLRKLAGLGSDFDFTIITEKDAGKMRDRWPDGSDEPVVANLDLAWELGGDIVKLALNEIADQAQEELAVRP